jgi:hypothetical protein
MRERYGWPTDQSALADPVVDHRRLHLGTILEDMKLSPLKLQLYAWHKWVGMLVLFLVPLRIAAAPADPLDHRAGPDALRGPRLRHRPRSACICC